MDTTTDPAPIFSSAAIRPRSTVYTYWTTDVDMMVRIEVATHPRAGGPIASVATRRDEIPGDEWRVLDAPAGVGARQLAVELIEDARRPL